MVCTKCFSCKLSWWQDSYRNQRTLKNVRENPGSRHGDSWMPGFKSIGLDVCNLDWICKSKSRSWYVSCNAFRPQISEQKHSRKEHKPCSSLSQCLLSEPSTLGHQLRSHHQVNKDIAADEKLVQPVNTIDYTLDGEQSHHWQVEGCL